MARMRLTTEEIKAYNHYKSKITTAKTSNEISHYKRKAQDILAIGRSRVAARSVAGTTLGKRSLGTMRRKDNVTT